jgi:hypothetical protein
LSGTTEFNTYHFIYDSMFHVKHSRVSHSSERLCILAFVDLVLVPKGIVFRGS